MGISEIARYTGLKPDEIKKVFEGVAHLLKEGNKVTIKHFGTFKLSKRHARRYSTPILGEFEVAAHYTTTFRPNRELRMMPLTKPTKQDQPTKRTGSKLGSKKKQSKKQKPLEENNNG